MNSLCLTHISRVIATYLVTRFVPSDRIISVIDWQDPGDGGGSDEGKRQSLDDDRLRWNREREGEKNLTFSLDLLLSSVG